MKLVKSGILILGIVGLTLMTIRMASSLPLFQVKATSTTDNLINMTVDQLKIFDGTDPKLPIYLAYEGNIYDITSGKSFYNKDGVYHFLAGKDSTTELNFAGGGIIKRKYVIIGKLLAN